MKKLGRVDRDKFLIGDMVRLQDMKSEKWTLKGIIEERREEKDGSTKSYLVRGGRRFLLEEWQIYPDEKNLGVLGEMKVRLSLKSALTQARQLAAGRQLA